MGLMSDAQFDKLPDCFRQVIQLDRRRREKVVAFQELNDRRFQRRMCEIHVLNCMGRTEGPGRPAAISASGRGL